jgi:hypothetical protein
VLVIAEVAINKSDVPDEIACTRERLARIVVQDHAWPRVAVLGHQHMANPLLVADIVKLNDA